ncbi:Exosome complex exonuclease RRP44 [Smittium mucronatum]|uniref:Exosome complex exonuclease RRP44 n=1 Tax=Smittium mucronatum TaxID=133383 RepID=A0A1R0GZN8_9FUNG|nr:Exosome complex exonuclease RRP44 [Smittium mucronatum]
MDITKQSIQEYLERKLILKSESNFNEHYPLHQIEDGLRSKTLVQGIIKKFTQNHDSGQKSAIIDRSASGNPNILIIGEIFLNRAVQGDTVAVKIFAENDKELLQVTESIQESQKLDFLEDNLTGETDQNDLDDGDQIIDSINDLHQKSEKERIIYGKVVGIIKRDWRPYVATVQLDDLTVR